VIDYYTRDGRPAEDYKQAVESGDKTVARTTVGASLVSTVFLALNHGYDGGPVLIFETLVFGGGLSDMMIRYSSEAEALAGHDEIVAKVRAEDEAMRALAERKDVREAVELVRDVLGEHAEQHKVNRMDHRDYGRLVEMVGEEISLEAG